MKITSSAVAMESDRQFVSYSQRKSLTLETSAQEAATLEFSEESKGLLEQMQENKLKVQQQEEQDKKTLASWMERQKENVGTDYRQGRQIPTAEELKLEILMRMLEGLRGLAGKGRSGLSEMKDLSREYKQAGRTAFSQNLSLTGTIDNVSVAKGAGKAAGAVENAAKWTRTTVESVFYTEAEHTAYEAQGMVKTSDGREINFGVTVEMSRAFCEKYTSVTQESYFCTDPLVINLDTNAASVTDQKFLFDLDSDGEEEKISFAGKGSGFLALDKNGDGKINDGNELFGTKSGNGFKDLAGYDKDGNGWIDENDDIFDDLKVWTKDENGNDRLIDLKKAGVGAIYLGYSDTEFSLNNMDTNQKNGIIRSTGIYLKESGEVGTLQHVDLVV